MGRGLKKPKGYRPTVQVAEEVKSRLVDWLDRHDRPDQGATVGRVLAFWLDQPEPIQQIILGRVPAGMESAYATFLRHLADQLEDKPRRVGGGIRHGRLAAMTPPGEEPRDP